MDNFLDDALGDIFGSTPIKKISKPKQSIKSQNNRNKFDIIKPKPSHPIHSIQSKSRSNHKNNKNNKQKSKPMDPEDILASMMMEDAQFQTPTNTKSIKPSND